MDLGDAVTAVEGIDQEGSGGEGSDGSLGLDDDIERVGHGGVVVVVAAGKACNWCRTGFWVV